MNRLRTSLIAGVAFSIMLVATVATAQPYNTSEPAQVGGLNGWNITPSFTVGETINGYTAPGIPDGMGAYLLDANTVRVFVNHELSDGTGYQFSLANGTMLDGSRVSYFDFDRATRDLLASGFAFDTVYDRDGNVVTSATQINEGIGPDPTVNGIDRLCSAWLGNPGQYGLVDRLFFTGEETSSGNGGQEFVLDAATGELWTAPALGRAAWEAVTMVDHPDPNKVAVVVGDDRGGAPFVLYVGQKDAIGDGSLLDRNGLAVGNFYVWVADNGDTSPQDWNGTFTSRTGSFQEVPIYDPAMAGMPGYDAQGYMTQATQDDYAFNTLGAFAFSRPEDVSTNPYDGTQVVMASTGRSSLFPADAWGTTYLFDFDFSGTAPAASAFVIYDGDDAGAGQFAGPDFGMRSPDNLVWAENGQIYLQEDRSVGGFGLTSGEETSIWQLDPATGELTRMAQVDRSGVPAGQTDVDPTDLGDWETSGIIDVTSLFDTAPGERLLFGNVQAHSLRGGVIDSANLVQGGQLFFASNTSNPGVDRVALFHNNDGESELLPSSDTAGIARFVATVERERTAEMAAGAGVVTVSSGDNFLPGPEFNASISNGIPFFDTQAIEKIGYDALALGNHDFDLTPDVLADFLAGFVNAPTYVAANLDFSGEPGLQAFVNSGVIANSTIVSTAAGDVGVIGATTPNIVFISSPRNTIINAVVPAVEAEIAALEAAGVNKIVLISHLQGLAEEVAVVSQLRGLDMVVAGGGDELLANAGNTLLPGDTAVGAYPATATDLDGKFVPVVTTSGNYRYVGRLVGEFTSQGELIGVDPTSGPVRVVGPSFADGVTPDAVCETNIEQPVAAALAAQAANVIAQSEVDLDGRRATVRFFESNQGNLVADALKWVATEQAAGFGLPAPDVALQNGGGMRDDRVTPAGDITELKTFEILPFANFVTITPNVTRAEFKEIMENCVSRALPADGGSGTGRFAQVSGMRMIWDISGTSQQIDPNSGAITVPGSRVKEIVLDDGRVIVANGVVVAGGDLTVTTVNFLANGGDQYPHLSNFTQLGATYQGALQQYLTDPMGLNGLVTAAQYPEGGEGRIMRFDPVSLGDEDDQPAPVQRTLALNQNYPNPFNPKTNIRFSLPKAQGVSLSIFDVKGRRVTTLVDGTLGAGDHVLEWNGTDHNGQSAASGQYFYVLKTEDRRLTKSMMLVK